MSRKGVDQGAEQRRGPTLTAHRLTSSQSSNAQSASIHSAKTACDCRSSLECARNDNLPSTLSPLGVMLQHVC